MGAVSSRPGEPARFVFPKCPTPFESMGLQCVMPCPAEKGFQRRQINGEFRCVYQADPQFFVPLSPIGAVVFEGTTLESLQTANPNAYTQFLKERDRFVGELAIVDGKISRETKLRDAFAKLQAAENVRDKSPEAYQQARSAYYTLKDGDKWIDQEKQRLLKAEVDPKAQSFVAAREQALGQFFNQRKTIDVVNGLKDRVLSLKDELKYSADTFNEQLGKVQDAINRENRTRETSKEVSLYDWLDTILNILILSALVYVIYLIARKVWFRRPSPTMPFRVGPQ